MQITTIEKDPDANLDYGFLWGKWLGTDTIVQSTWIVPDGLTSINSTFTSNTTIVWVSGGILGQTYTITNRITTAAGRTDDRSITLYIKNR